MKPQFPAIKLRDWFTPVAVWELQGKCWRLLRVERLAKAIALCRQSPKRLMFPTQISPNGMLGGVCSKSSTQEQDLQFEALSRTQKMILDLIRTTPGCSSKFLAGQLDISRAAVGQHLRKLEFSGEIYYCIDPLTPKRRLYYPGVAAAKTQANASTSNSRLSLPNREERPRIKLR